MRANRLQYLYALRRIIKSNQKVFAYWRNETCTNCYAYALGLDVDENRICYNAYFGGRMYNYFMNSSKDLRNLSNAELIELDFKILFADYEEIGINDKLKVEDGIKIALYNEVGGDDYDFHFFKQDLNSGIWFHKPGRECLPTCYDDANSLILNPLDANLGTSYAKYVYQKTYRLVPFK